MPIVAQGGTVTLRANVGHSNGSPADDPALTLTILDTPGDPVAGFPVAIPPIVRDDLGAYHYVWAVPALLPLGDYTATWDATVDGADAGGSEQVEVVAAGTIGTDGLSVTQLRQFITSSLGDEALQILLNAEAAAIIAAAGATGEVTEHIQTGYYHRIVLDRPAGTIASVTEYNGGVPTVLETDDYRAEGYVLTRTGRGTNPSWRWAPHVVVVHTPTVDTAEWQRVQVDLVRLDLSRNPGVTAETIGTWSVTYAGPTANDDERAAILASLGVGGRMTIVADDEWASWPVIV